MSDETSGGDRQTTNLAKRWVFKTLIITAVLLGFGVWGLVDALVVYPNRGERVASYQLWQHLKSMRDPSFGFAGEIKPNGDPSDVLTSLQERENTLRTDIASSSARLRQDAERDLTRMQWYEALAVIGRLTEERTTIDNPGQELDDLELEWSSNATAPKPLASYDIPVQWVFVVVGFGGGTYGLIFFAGVARKKYAWEPGEMRLTLDDGNTIVPADVEVFDRRKWDKFLYFLRIKDGHESLAGQEVKVDLYRYEPLEDWVVAMHKHVAPEDFEDEEEAQEEAQHEDQQEASDGADAEAAGPDSEEDSEASAAKNA